MDLLDKYFKQAIVKMFKKLNENMYEELKEDMRTMSPQITSTKR